MHIFMGANRMFVCLDNHFYPDVFCAFPPPAFTASFPHGIQSFSLLFKSYFSFSSKRTYSVKTFLHCSKQNAVTPTLPF